MAGQYALASMLRQRDRRLELEAILRQRGRGDIPRMMRATFAVAIPQRFGQRVHLSKIGAFVTDVRDNFYEPLALMRTEYLIRCALGEDLTVPGLEIYEEILAKSLVLGAIADYWNRDEAKLAAAVVQAESNVAASGYELIPA